jgi:hypothetical protein
MMIRPAELSAIRRGDVDLAFRRWDRPRVRVGTRMRTGVGLVEVTGVDQVGLDDLTDDDARRAGATSVDALVDALAHRPDTPVWRVGLHFAGADPREALRDEVPDEAELARLRAWLDRLDAAAPYGPWTRETLTIIGDNPGRRAPELAAGLGRETAEFKRDVRKLKEKGLTQSLDIGYLLSARGAAVLGGRAVAGTRSGTPLPRVGAPASRALTAAGITSLESLGGHTEASVAALHGVGPFALTRLREALDAAGLDYAPAG